MDALNHQDYNTYSALYCIYDTLVSLRDGEYQPHLAESWEVNDAGDEWIFHLVKGVKFHDGSELKASDVIFTINTARKSAYTKERVEMITEATAVDDYTVKLKLKGSFGPFLGMMKQLCIVSEKNYTAAGDTISSNPGNSGCGPFKFVEWIKGTSLTLERNDDYYRGPANVKTIIFKPITEKSTAIVALQTGEIDMYTSISSADKQTVEDDPNLVLDKCNGQNVYSLHLNCKDPLMADPKVREAISYAIDKESIILGAFDGSGAVAEVPIASNFNCYPDGIKGHGYDPKKAKALLAEAGYPNGFEMTISIIDDEIYKRPCEIIQANLKDIGIDCQIATTERGSFFSTVFTPRNYQAMMIRFGGNYPDADSSLYSAFYSTGQNNLDVYKSAELDKLLDTGRWSMDQAERDAAYRSASQLIIDQSVSIPILSDISYLAYVKGVQGAHATPDCVYRPYAFGW
jgi:peptide/nickel transport system substrate-binding protein